MPKNTSPLFWYEDAPAGIDARIFHPTLWCMNYLTSELRKFNVTVYFVGDEFDEVEQYVPTTTVLKVINNTPIDAIVSDSETGQSIANDIVTSIGCDALTKRVADHSRGALAKSIVLIEQLETIESDGRVRVFLRSSDGNYKKTISIK